MSLLENKTLVLRYFTEAPEHPEICEQIFKPTFQFHTLQRASLTAQTTESNPESERAAYAWLREVWGDWYMTVDQVIAEGELVMVCWTFHGVQQGEYYGLPPTRRTVTYSGVNIFRVEAGKLAEIWDLSDRLWLWQQLGVIPEIKDAIARTNEGSS